MTILASDLKWYGSQNMPDDDTPTAIGGAIDLTKKVEFFDNNGLVQLVSSTSVDTTQQVTVSYRNTVTPTSVLTEAKTLNGLTPVAFAANMERLLKAIKNAFTLGDIAIESQTAVRTGTAQAGAGDNITLDAGASAVDNFYQAMVIRITAGTGINQIREIIAYVGATKVAEVDHAWSPQPDVTSQFRISKGIVFEKTPVEVISVRRPFFDSAADVPGGSPRTYFEKIFARNMHAVQVLSSGVVSKQADLTGEVTFALATTTNDAGTNGAGNNRQVAPSSGVTAFDNANKSVPGNTLGPGNVPGSGTTSAVGVWLKLSRAAGDAALNAPVTMRLQGTTS